MRIKPILVVAGEPDSIFFEIFFKSIKINFKSPIVLICSKDILIKQLKKFKCACIDCGFLVDALSDIKLAKKRIYHLNDFFYNKKKYF